MEKFINGEVDEDLQQMMEEAFAMLGEKEETKDMEAMIERVQQGAVV